MNHYEKFKNITIIAHAIGPYGGQEKAMEEFALHAKRSGIDVGIVSYKVSDEIKDAGISVKLIYEPRSIFLIRFIWFWIISPFYIRKLPSSPLISCGAITKTKVDAAWMHFWHDDHLKKTKWFTSWEGNLSRFVSQTISRLTALLAEHWMLRIQKPSILVAVSDSEGMVLAEKYPQARILVLPNPVAKSKRSVFEEQLENPNRERRIIFVGGSWGPKGLLRVAKAASTLANRREAQIQLSILGKGSPALLKKIRSLSNLKVEYIPWSDDVGCYLASSDLFMLASKYETFSMAGHEALAAGLPVISTEVYGLADAIRSTGLGIVTDRGIESLAQAADSLLWRNPPSIAQRQLAMSRISSAFGDETIGQSRDELIQVLSTCASRKNEKDR